VNFPLEWLNDDQDHDSDKQKRRSLIDDAEETRAVRYMVSREIPPPFRKEAVDHKHKGDKRNLDVEPDGRRPPARRFSPVKDHPDPYPHGDDHGGVHDAAKQPALHDFERFGLRRPNANLRMINIESWQV